jgi:hypothetical protein
VEEDEPYHRAMTLSNTWRDVPPLHDTARVVTGIVACVNSRVVY